LRLPLLLSLRLHLFPFLLLYPAIFLQLLGCLWLGRALSQKARLIFPGGDAGGRIGVSRHPGQQEGRGPQTESPPGAKFHKPLHNFLLASGLPVPAEPG
jgi:hypothetical protein